MDPSIVNALIAAVAVIAAALIGLIGVIISRRGSDNKGGVAVIGLSGRKYLPEPTAIRSDKRNRLRIESDFLHWAQCTMLLWGYVPPKGEALRDSPHNRYLIAHITGETDRGDWTYYNQFALRHSSTRGRWELQFSNGRAKYPDSSLWIGDGLNVGWHQFMIAWNNEIPKLTFIIDGGKGGTELSTSYRSFWPDKLDEKASVGGWTSDYSGHYCETRLYRLWILESFLEPTDSIVKEHFKLKPPR